MENPLAYVTFDNLIYVTVAGVTLTLGASIHILNKVAAVKGANYNTNSLLQVTRQQVLDNKADIENHDTYIKLLEERLRRIEDQRNLDMVNTAEIFSRVNVTLTKLNSSIEHLDENFTKSIQQFENTIRDYKKDTVERFNKIEEKLEKKVDKKK